jgi:hypothetical protein
VSAVRPVKAQRAELMRILGLSCPSFSRSVVSNRTAGSPAPLSDLS